ncbi:MAG TPA: carboxypeptidase-like regulatory domain-containing protein, partial [Puia sp.]|nr:carboxypeptidase-like regulatory domain-containing protein [Puia sp.]
MMKTKKIVTGFVFLIFSHFLSLAQSKYSGAVRDENGKPVIGATIHILNTDVSVVSNNYGLYQLPVLPAGVYSAEISSIGFARLEKKIKYPLGSDSLIFILPPTVTQLDAVVVTAEKQESNIQNVPVSITALSSR